jgi:hypothetical protein
MFDWQASAMGCEYRNNWWKEVALIRSYRDLTSSLNELVAPENELSSIY